MTVFTKGVKKTSIKEDLNIDASRIKIETDDGLEIIDIDFAGLTKQDETRVKGVLASKQFIEKI